MSKLVHSFLALFLLLASGAVIAAKNVQFVSDQLTIPMRSGPSTNHKILKFLTSGTPVNIIETSTDRAYAQISLLDDESRTGWVETGLLMTEPSARDQLVTASKNSQSMKEKQTELKEELTGLKQQYTQLNQNNKQLEARIQELLNNLEHLRESAANPIRVAEENQALKQQLLESQNHNAELSRQNAFLTDKNIKEWFLIGAGVSIGSLLLGLLITRIRWKKRDSWAGSF